MTLLIETEKNIIKMIYLLNLFTYLSLQAYDNVSAHVPV